MATAENIRALVVEDRPEMARQLKRVLEKKFPFQVEIAHDCAAAREKLSEEAFDLVTLDFMLPDGRGLDLLEEITSAGGLTKVIMVTGHGDEESAVRSFRSQASGYIIKDSNLASRLAEAVEKALMEADLQRARAELVRREAHFRSLTEKSSDMITVIRGDGTIMYESPSIERFLGYKASEMIGRNVFDFVHPDDAGRVMRQVEGAIDTPGSVLVMEYRFRHKEGPWRNIESLGRNLLTDQVVGGIVLNYRDVTRRKRAELELDRYRRQLEHLVEERTAELADANVLLRAEIAERMQAEAELKERAESLADFLTVASHELRHPISVVKGYTTMLQGYLERMEPESLPEILEALDKSVDRLTGYVDELLEASLVEQGMYTFDIVESDLDPIIAESVEDLRALGVANKVSVKTGEGAGRAKVDPVKFKRLMDMLLNNAIKFSEGPEPIDIETRRTGETITVSVMDRGIGIPEDLADRVFERFFQVEDVSHHSRVGLGVGLYLARQIVTAHGGTITCEPRPDGGTIFSLTLSAA
ncbi:MAG: sensor histidine kinase [Candidatus Geothermincolia bacterium]